MSDARPAVSDTMSDYDRRVRQRPNTVGEAILCVDKVHGGSNAWRQYTTGKPGPVDAKARLILGDELHSYCRARLMTGSKLEVVPQPVEADETFNRRLRANLLLDMLSDIDTWERAMDQIGRLQTAAHRAGLPLPPPLTIPEAVLIAIAQRQAERAERLARREGGGGRGGKGGSTRPSSEPSGTEEADNDGASSSLKGGGKRKRRDDDEDGGGFTPPVPAGPRR